MLVKDCSRWAFSGLAGLLLLGTTGSANAALLKSYDFDSGLSDTLGAGVDLTASGGTVSGGRYTFGGNQGLRLTSALASTSDYGIEIKMKMDAGSSGFSKLVDFQDLASDLGLYVLNGTIDFYTVGPTGGSVPVETEVTIGLERKAGVISVFLNGGLVITGADGGGQGVPAGNILNFFEDDYSTGQRESFAGSADFIRIHDDASTFGTVPSPIPVPTSLPLLAGGLGLFGLIGARRKRKAA